MGLSYDAVRMRVVVRTCLNGQASEEAPVKEATYELDHTVRNLCPAASYQVACSTHYGTSPEDKCQYDQYWWI